MQTPLTSGYLSEALWNALKLGSLSEYRPNRQFINHLCHFQMTSFGGGGVGKLPQYPHPVLAVVHNMIRRGLPTLPSVLVEDYLSEKLGMTARLEEERLGSVTYRFNEPDSLPKENDWGKLLCFVDPFFQSNDYDFHKLDERSPGEKQFISTLFSNSDNIIPQLLQPQRSVDELVNGEARKQFKYQRVDFAFEPPVWSNAHKEDDPRGVRKGLVIEVDGSQHSTNPVQVHLDEKRDLHLANSDFKTVRTRVEDLSISVREVVDTLSQYPYFIKTREFCEVIKNATDQERKLLQLLYCPMAISRVQMALVHFLLGNPEQLKSDQPVKVALIERDFSAGKIAGEDLTAQINRILRLLGEEKLFPGFDIDVFASPHFSAWEMFRDEDIRDIVLWESADSFDCIVDHSILRRDGIEASEVFLDKSSKTISLRSCHLPDQFAFNYNHEPKQRFISASPIKYPPIARLKNDEQFEENEKKVSELKGILQDVFRKLEFRPGQIPILNRALSRKNVIGLLPTGGGKSLTYQLASFLQPGVTLIIDPIKSLMQDQVAGLRSVGVDAATAINSSLNFDERRIAEQELLSGAVLFSFVSPERLVIDRFRNDVLKGMSSKGVFFSYCVIDEVHCVSEWGHDFRTPYLSLGKNCVDYCHTMDGSPVSLFGLTATASFDVLSDVERELFVNPEEEMDALVRHEHTNRPELNFVMVPVKVDYPRDKGFWKGKGQGLPNPLQAHGYWAQKNIKDEAGVERKRQLIKILKEHCSTDLVEFNSSLDEIIKHEREEYLTDLPPETQLELTKRYKKWLPIDKTISDSARQWKNPSDAGALIFCPHRQGGLGVTDLFNLRFDRQLQQLVPKSPREGIFDELQNQSFEQSGFFMGSDGKKNIEEDSMKNQERFVQNDLSIMVATKAFGMGIDKPNIRMTLHMNHTSSLEAFVQESGRAGRDRKMAVCYCLVDESPLLSIDFDQFLKLKEKYESDEWTPSSSLWPLFFDANLYETYFLISDFTESENNEVQKLYGDIKGIAQESGIPNPFRELSLDRTILEFFHFNSFKGALKEKVNVFELLDEISVPLINKIEGELNESFADSFDGDITLTPWTKNGKERIYVKLSGEDIGNFDFGSGQYFGSSYQNVGSELISLLKKRSYKQITSGAFKIKGILSLLNKSSTGSQIEVLIPFENSSEHVLSNIKKAFERYNFPFGQKEISSAYKSSSSFEDFLEALERELNRNRQQPVSIRERFAELDRKDNLLEGTKLGKLEVYFSGIRETNDTLKAIYRLICAGVVDDYTIDYNAKVVKVQVTKHPDDQYIASLEKYFKRYLSDRLVENKIKEVRKLIAEDNNTPVLKHCVEAAIDFAYEQVAEKRYLAISDVEAAIKEALNEKEDKVKSSFAFKDFVYLYFNSKYARQGNETPSGQPASLLDDIMADDFDSKVIFSKYLEIPLKDESGPTLTNLKHLRGACLRSIRARPDLGVLRLIKAFTLIALSGRNPRLLSDAYQDFKEGLSRLRQEGEISDSSDLLEWVELMREYLFEYSTTDETKRNIEDFIDSVFVQWYEGWAADFAHSYIN